MKMDTVQGHSCRGQAQTEHGRVELTGIPDTDEPRSSCERLNYFAIK